ncbi:MarR family winged helix-turn-helix transcriptional regulator [Tropicibacter naphthalenivorans]|uniref:Organic hydroperoxide resistance transcriptional regulator n=1 Tax=Tropicibacter naphthalenivorans TaxID=441103 RepID=A0A0P1GMV7_9RHOB|nr:MarR family transcriptional regulator [Tropicibacter naphthalenivorans]CUH75964.1 Organic hydroperoxide resistance transcriptional regulator [Tropicibacter naphthalenivorans]SMC40966.1 DNA-binding transcriptional regulator, MarR family [Tropicibacter naphthalenivorans]
MTGPTVTEEVKLGPMADSLGFLLRLSQLESFRDFYTGMEDLGMRPGEFSVLMLIGENPGIRQGVLARKLMIKRAHMTKMVQAMEADGLVTRTVPPEDKRSIELRLSEQGAARLAHMRGPFEEHESRNLSRLSDAELDTLKRLLKTYLDVRE